MPISFLEQILDCPDKNLEVIGEVSQMKQNGWSFERFDVDGSSTMSYEKKGWYNEAAEYCGGDGTWYGWSSGEKAGVLSTTFQGSGTFTLGFGNCWTNGKVKAYLNGREIGSASPGRFFFFMISLTP